MRRAALVVLAALSAPALFATSLVSCSGTRGVTPPLPDGGGGGGGSDAGHDAPPPDAPPYDGPVFDAPMPPHDALPPDAALPHNCDRPGSIQFTSKGKVIVPGQPPGTDLDFLQLPVGFCAHLYGNVGNARQLKFAPGGELFVASPTTGTTGGGQNGQAAIVVLPDDNNDGLADAPVTFLGSLPSTQGLLFAKDHFYYQDGTKILRVPYKAGERAPSAAGELVADITVYVSAGHWPKAMDVADDGTIYVSNGGDQGEACDPFHPFHGGILALDGTPGGTQISKGFRNPIAVKCAQGHNECFALELSRDYSAQVGGREKMVPIHKGDDVGFPCCATKDLPYPDVKPTPDCSGVSPDNASFLIGDTPFGLAFAPSQWPGKWANRAYVALHGTVGVWTGARLVSIAMDPTTGLTLPGHDLDGGSTGAMVDFGTGWDDGSHMHGHPAALEMSADGRLFVANDATGMIFWIAPLDP